MSVKPKIRKKRRALIKHAASVTALAALYAAETSKNPRQGNIFRGSFDFMAFSSTVSDTQFRRMYRMSRKTFQTLAALLIGDDLRVFDDRRGRFGAREKLSMTIRWLAGGSYLDVAINHHCAPQTLYSFIEETMKEMDRKLKIRFPVESPDELEKNSHAFSRGRSPLTGCVGAIDGIAIAIQEPETCNSQTYYNRKGFFALNVQALADPFYRFLYISSNSPGSTHDSTAFSMTDLCKVLESGALRYPYWIAGDEAYTATQYILTPWPGSRLDAAKDTFNYWKSSARIFVEQTFGIFVARWGIFWRKLRVPLVKATLIIHVCAKVHNFIIENESSGIIVPPRSNVDTLRFNGTTYPQVFLQDECDINEREHHRRRDLEICTLRDQFTEEIRALGLRRPRI